MPPPWAIGVTRAGSFGSGERELRRDATPMIAISTFNIENWDGSTWDEADGGTLARARVVKTFQGDIEGTSVAEILTLQSDVPLAYVGLERINAAIHGAKGTFVLQHNAGTTSDGELTASWGIVPGTGTGALEGISGSATIDRHDDGSHSFSMDYLLA